MLSYKLVSEDEVDGFLLFFLAERGGDGPILEDGDVAIVIDLCFCPANERVIPDESSPIGLDVAQLNMMITIGLKPTKKQLLLYGIINQPVKLIMLQFKILHNIPINKR